MTLADVTFNPDNNSLDNDYDDDGIDDDGGNDTSEFFFERQCGVIPENSVEWVRKIRSFLFQIRLCEYFHSIFPFILSIIDVIGK